MLIAIVAGLLLGSFLNVCIYRWPRDLSVVHPRSRCTHCEKQIDWFDNIPILSYLLLGGRCRNCRASIHWRYPLVELMTAACFGWFVSHYGLSAEAARGCIFAFILIGLVFSDLETLLLPDELTIGGIVIGLAFSVAVPMRDSTFNLVAMVTGFHLDPRLTSLGESALGATVPSGLMWLMGTIFAKLRNKDGLGFGDVKMIAMIGAFLGLMGTLQTIVLASVAGSVIGILWIKLSGKASDTYQPFGSFLGLAALATAMAGQNWFWSVFGGT